MTKWHQFIAEPRHFLAIAAARLLIDTKREYKFLTAFLTLGRPLAPYLYKFKQDVWANKEKA